MPSKLSFYAQMADHTAKQVTGSFGEWTALLERIELMSFEPSVLGNKSTAFFH